MTDHQQVATASLDVAAGAAVVSTLFGWLPDIAAVLGIAWYCLQIWESKTVQSWHKRRRSRR